MSSGDSDGRSTAVTRRRAHDALGRAASAPSDLVAGMELFLSGLVAMVARATFAVAFGAIALGFTLRALGPSANQPYGMLLALGFFGVAALLGRLVDDVYDSWRAARAAKRSELERQSAGLRAPTRKSVVTSKPGAIALDVVPDADDAEAAAKPHQQAKARP